MIAAAFIDIIGMILLVLLVFVQREREHGSKLVRAWRIDDFSSKSIVIIAGVQQTEHNVALATNIETMCLICYHY